MFNSKSVNRYPVLDIMRASAIILVMGHHFRKLPDAPYFFKWIFMRGYIGVDIFFVLSGWLIAGQLFKDTIFGAKRSIKSFLARRLLRTLPCYYAALAASMAAGIVSVKHWKTMIFFLQNYTAPHEYLISWSLCIEEHFYLALPFLCLGLAKILRKKIAWFPVILFLLVLSSVFLRWQTFSEVQKKSYHWFISSLYSPTHLRLDGLFLGVLLAYLHHAKSSLWLFMERNALLFGLLGIFLILFSTWNPILTGSGTRSSLRMLFFPAVLQFFFVSLGSCFLIVMGVSHSKAINLSAPGSLWLSEHAYTLYLTHMIGIHYIQSWFGKGEAFVTNLLFAASLSIAFSVVLRHLVEVPGLNLRKKLFGNSAQRP